MTREDRLLHALWSAEGRAERRYREAPGSLLTYQASRLALRLERIVRAEYPDALYPAELIWTSTPWHGGTR